MQIELTEKQQQVQESHAGGPLRVVNPHTKEVFILLPADAYERMKSIFDEGFDPRESYPMVDRIMAEDDANDPCLESYQHFQRENRP